MMVCESSGASLPWVWTFVRARAAVFAAPSPWCRHISQTPHRHTNGHTHNEQEHGRPQNLPQRGHRVLLHALRIAAQRNAAGLHRLVSSGPVGSRLVSSFVVVLCPENPTLLSRKRQHTSQGRLSARPQKVPEEELQERGAHPCRRSGTCTQLPYAPASNNPTINCERPQASDVPYSPGRRCRGAR